MPSIKSAGPSWSFDDIVRLGIESASVRDDEHIFHILVAASFIEAATHKYASNLCEHFHDDPEVCQWLKQGWEPEELNHGAAIRRYIGHVWPAFDWQRAYDGFLAEYSLTCTVEELENSRALEMAARCVVEMGTSTYYGAIRQYAGDPALRQMATLIRRDEVGHYKHFYRYFLKYNALEGNGRLRVFGALWRRLLEIRSGDADCALWHVFSALHPQQERDGAAFRQEIGEIARILRSNYPTTTAIKMFLKPLGLAPVVQRAVIPPVNQAARHIFLQ